MSEPSIDASIAPPPRRRSSSFEEGRMHVTSMDEGGEEVVVELWRSESLPEPLFRRLVDWQRSMSTILEPEAIDKAALLLNDALGVEQLVLLQRVSHTSTAGFRIRRTAGLSWDLKEHSVLSPSEIPHAESLLSSGEPMRHFSQLEQLPAGKEDEILKKMGVCSGVVVPVLRRRSPFGVMGVYSASERHFSAWQIELVQSMASMLSVRMQASLAGRRASVEEVPLQRAVDPTGVEGVEFISPSHVLLESTPAAVMLFDENCKVVTANPAALALFEAPSLRDVLQHSVLALLDPGYVSEVTEPRVRDLLTLGHYGRRHAGHRRSGSSRSISSAASGGDGDDDDEEESSGRLPERKPMLKHAASVIGGSSRVVDSMIRRADHHKPSLRRAASEPREHRSTSSPMPAIISSPSHDDDKAKKKKKKKGRHATFAPVLEMSETPHHEPHHEHSWAGAAAAAASDDGAGEQPPGSSSSSGAGGGKYEEDGDDFETHCSNMRVNLMVGRRFNGESFPLEVVVSEVALTMRDTDGTPVHVFTGTFRDMTERSSEEMVEWGMELDHLDDDLGDARSEGGYTDDDDGASVHSARSRSLSVSSHATDLFVEMEELEFVEEDQEVEWTETARWQHGLEEDVVRDGNKEKFTRGHLGGITFHSAFELRRSIRGGIVMLDCVPDTPDSLLVDLVNNWVSSGLLPEDARGSTLAALRLHHHHCQKKKKKRRRLSRKKKEVVDVEAMDVLVGGVDFLEEPVVAFVRLETALVLPEMTEDDMPVKFLFILLGPSEGTGSYHEIGRAIAVMMSEPSFRDEAHVVPSKTFLLRAVDRFMDRSVVIPSMAPGGVGPGSIKWWRMLRGADSVSVSLPHHVVGYHRRLERRAEFFQQQQDIIKLNVASGEEDEEYTEGGKPIRRFRRSDYRFMLLLSAAALGLILVFLLWGVHHVPPTYSVARLSRFNTEIESPLYSVELAHPLRVEITAHEDDDHSSSDDHSHDGDSHDHDHDYTADNEAVWVVDVKLLAPQLPAMLQNATVSWSFVQRVNGSYTTVGDISSLQLKKDGQSEALETYDLRDSASFPTWNEKKQTWLQFETDSPEPLALMAQPHVMDGFGRWRVLIGAILLCLVYVLIVLDVVHRTLAAMLGSFGGLTLLGIAGEAPSLNLVVEWMDEGTLALLFGMMVMVALLSTTGFFEWCAVRAVRYSGGKLFKLAILLCMTTALLSAFLDNVTTMLLLGPVTLELSKVLSLDPKPFLIAEALFSNIGGTMTMIGDPPNIIIGNALREHLGFVDFIYNTSPGIILMYLPAIWLVHRLFRDTFDGSREVDIDKLIKRYPITNWPLLAKCAIVLFTVILLLFLEPLHHKPAAWIALIGAVALLLVASPHELHHTLEMVEWDTLLFFASLFVLIEALAELGLIRAIGNVIAAAIAAAPEETRLTVAIVLILWVSGITSAFLDNIPYCATMVPVVVLLSEHPELNLPLRPLAWALSFGCCLGGNGTLVGASANLVTAGMAEHAGHRIGFVEFMKAGMPVLLLTLAIATGYMLVVYVALGWGW